MNNNDRKTAVLKETDCRDDALFILPNNKFYSYCRKIVQIGHSQNYNKRIIKTGRQVGTRVYTFIFVYSQLKLPICIKKTPNPIEQVDFFLTALQIGAEQ